MIRRSSRLAAALAFALAPGAALGAWALPAGQSFVGAGTGAGLGEAASPVGAPSADSPDSASFAEGTKAINESRWGDAARIFASTVAQRGEHVEGALYWKAYAEQKLGKGKAAEESCGQLHASFPKSPWNEDCGALLVEIRSQTGKPIQIDPASSDDVKLLALNAMMHQDEPRALAQMQAILNSEASERLKKEAAFILGQHYSDITYAQIVRIRYAEGDVRIQRGQANRRSDGGLWEKAISDLPLESGFSLVTGRGRAEIEFENASTLYLGENSVLVMNDLHETAGVPYTEIALLAGTVSLQIHPYVAGEKFVLHTPSDDLVSKFPDKTNARVQSFTNGIAITPLEGGELRLPGVPRDQAQPGHTWTYRQGKLSSDALAVDDTAMTEWDKWVSNRSKEREKTVAAVMEESGLSAPIPGMAEMAGQGTFSACAPYGMCWEPKEQANTEAGFPCAPSALGFRMIKDPITGKNKMTATALAQTRPYDWAVCHAGGWIPRQSSYAWVASARRRHIDPVRWVKSGRTLAIVPLHPYDVKGQPPINGKGEVFEVSGKGEASLRPVQWEPDRPLQFLDQPPKEYRVAALRPLERVESPTMEAHALGTAWGDRAIALDPPEVPLRFDPQSLSFAIPRQDTRGGQAATVYAPLTNRSGSLQVHGESLIGGSGARGHGGFTGPRGGAPVGASRPAAGSAAPASGRSMAPVSAPSHVSAGSSSAPVGNSGSGTKSPH